MFDEQPSFLSQVAPEYQNKVNKIIQLKMSIDARIQRLEEYLTVSQLRECRKWLEKKAGDFVSLLSDSDQEFVEEYFDAKDIPVLDAVLQNYDENTRSVYEMWKQLAGFGLKETMEPPQESLESKKKKTKMELEEEIDKRTKTRNPKAKHAKKLKAPVTESEESEEETETETDEDEKPNKKKTRASSQKDKKRK